MYCGVLVTFIFEFSNSLSEKECKNMIARFEESKSDHYKGRVGQNFKENTDIKFIASVTGFTIDEILKLQNKM